ncbi:MAG: 4Fe-4S binding protein [Candidatus Gastranaerophilaceae bacterium]|jgi:Ni,Fe-hydrogenase III small subunit/NAD-dependent dihydropyrimidine dehydrogenase PreA subunit
MFKTLRSIIYQGNQFIPDVKKAVINEKFRGFPALEQNLCSNCTECEKICPTGAIKLNPLQIDMGKCIFCGDCENFCDNKAIKFSNFHKLATTNREKLIITSGISPENFYNHTIVVNEKIKKIFGKSLKLRQVSAGGCNGCELELNACSNVNFDMGRFGIDFVDSPRHSDGIVITGPITENMAYALEDAYKATPDPKIVILTGTCAISGGVFQHSTTINRAFLKKHNIDLFIPGCPPHPLTFINGVLDFLK